nr:Chain C, Neuronal calcium sensor 1 [Homo sapiens]5O9S_D Chain D, Neuronal calcium sensor 1 [Homo sapiens]
GKSNSKLK